MDLNELFSRHQVALMGMMHASSPARRDWAQQCANYYADRIDTARPTLNGARPVINACALKQIVHG